MTLISIEQSEFNNVQFDPDYFNAGDIQNILSPDIEPTDDDGPALPDDLAQLFETGGTRAEATAAVRNAFHAGIFDNDDPIPDRAAFFDNLLPEINGHPTPETFDAKLAEANMAALQLFKFTEDDTQAIVEADGKIILQIHLGKGKDNGKDFAKLVLFVQTVLDIIALGFALLNIGLQRGKSWAKTIAKKLGKAEKWFKKAKSAFGKFNGFYKKYKNLTQGDGKMTKREIFEKLGGAFGKAFLGFFGDVLKQSLKIVKELLSVIFGTWGDVVRFLIRVGIAIAEWLGYSLTQLGVVIVNALIAATHVLDDILAWRKMA